MIFAVMKVIIIILQYLIMDSVLSFFESESSLGPDINQTRYRKLVTLTFNFSPAYQLCPYSVQLVLIIQSNLMLFCIRKDSSKRIRHQIIPKSILSTGIINIVILWPNRASKRKNVFLMRKIVSRTVNMQNISKGAVLYFFQRIKKFHML